jgi:DNA-binding MarR family transcriptional regulator
LLKKILGLLGKTEPKAPTRIAENNNTYQDKDKEELLNRIKILEEKQQEMLNSHSHPNKPENEEDYTLTEKQIEFALTLIEKIRDYQLVVEPSKLTVKDLNRLVAYNRYNNKGAIVNLEKKGILKRKPNVLS